MLFVQSKSTHIKHTIKTEQVRLGFFLMSSLDVSPPPSRSPLTCLLEISIYFWTALRQRQLLNGLGK